MPCYEIRTVSVQFKAENIGILKRAIEAEGHTITFEEKTAIGVSVGRRWVAVDLERSTVTSSDMNQAEISSFANSLKRAYSATVIDEVAKRNKWLKRDMGQNRYQLQRF